MRRWIGGALAALLLLVVVGVGLLVAADANRGNVPTDPPPAAPQALAQTPATTRHALPPPPGVDPAPPSRNGHGPPRMTPEDRKLMNYSVDDVLKVARAECLQGWVDTVGEDTEIVFDVVLSDGRVMDIGLRSLGAPVTREVLSCVADKAWLSDWPEWDLPGELRLQRSITVDPHAEAP